MKIKEVYVMKTRILIVDDNEEFVETLVKHFENDENCTVIGTALSGLEALDKYAELKPDVMLLDIVMPGMDGFCVLEQLDKAGGKVVMVSALSQDSFITKAINLGADYYLVKPLSYDTLSKTITEICDGKEVKVEQKEKQSVKRLVRNGTLDERLSNIFITVGIPAHIKGYHFLREAIKMAIETPDIINSITKRLYPEVAIKFSTSSSKVERAIRHAIEVAWNRGKIENINSLFGIRVYNHNEKPTNGEFIALVADKMLLESV